MRGGGYEELIASVQQPTGGGEVRIWRVESYVVYSSQLEEGGGGGGLGYEELRAT